MLGFIPNVVKLARRTFQPTVTLLQLPTFISSNEIVAPGIRNPWCLTTIRTIVRNHFPKASEYKRLKTHGWRVKLKTRSGRRQLMRRILKGRYYLAH